MAHKTADVLTEDFLMDLYYSCMSNEYLLATVITHFKNEYLPDRDFIGLHKAFVSYYKQYKRCPSYGVLQEIIGSNRNVQGLLKDIRQNCTETMSQEEAIDLIENYIVKVRLQKTLKESVELFNNQDSDKTIETMRAYIDWQSSFHLKSPEYLDIANSFEERFSENRAKHNAVSTAKPITRFYIDELDVMNQNQDLRTQLTCILAPTGVGKSHAARWIGKNASMVDGLNVLHFQLEGSRNEVANAYSASLVSCNTYRYSTGTLRDVDVEKMLEMLTNFAGKLYVKSYPKFASHVSTIDIRNSIHEFKKQFNITPDIVIIDSMDLLTDSSGRRWSDNAERHKRIAVANDLKDLAADENVWMVVTYQSTIENKEWLNDEKNVLTEYNTAEAKGIARPCTHLISLNQSDRERREHTMRIHVAKSRFFEKGETIRIATDFEHEVFYDSVRTLNLNKVN